MTTVILSAVLALFAHLRALSDGYTDEAALGRAVTAFALAFVALQLVGVAWRAIRARRGVVIETPARERSATALPSYPPRRSYPSDRDTDRNRAA